MERKNDYIYNLNFINKEGKIICTKPLSNVLRTDFVIPENTLWIDFKINKLEENNTYVRYTLYNFIVESDLLEKFQKDKDKYFIVTSKYKFYPNFSDINLIIFKTKTELQAFIKSLIVFFHDNPYGQLNNKLKYDDNIESHNLYRKLTKQIINRTEI